MTSATQPAGGTRSGPLGASVSRIAFLLLYLAGGLYGTSTLFFAWEMRLLVQLLAERTLVLRILHLPWIIVPLGLALALALIWVEFGRIGIRWIRGVPEPDIAVRARAAVYAAFGALLVNVFVLSTPETFSGPFRVRFAINAQICTTLVFGTYALWALMLPRVRDRLSFRVRRAWDLIGMNVVLLLALTETTLRVAAIFWPSPLVITQSSPSQIRRDSDRQSPGTLRFGFPMNHGGHYDTEFAARSATRKRVVTEIGDSFSYGVVPHQYHFTTVAERQLRDVDIYNIGYPGLSPSDYFYLLQQEALPLQPDLVLVNLYVGNDVAAGAAPAGPARWYDADRYLTAIVWYRLQIMRRAQLIDVSESGKATTGQEPVTATYPWLADPLLEQPTLSHEVYGQLETRNALAIAVPHQGIYQPFFQTLTDIVKAAENIRLGFVIIPDEFQVEEDLWREVGQRAGTALDRDLAQRTIVDWLRRHGLPVLDLLPLMRAVPPLKDGRRHLYQLQDTHFNARGNALAGQALAPFIDSLLSAPYTAMVEPSEPLPLPFAPESLPYHLTFGESAARQWMWTGWSDDESGGGRTYVWSAGTRSALRVIFPTRGDVELSFEVNPFVFPGGPEQRIAVEVNGNSLEEVPVEAGVHRYTVLLPATMLGDTANTLAFRYAYARAPQEVLRGSTDTRTLAVAWYSMDFSSPAPASNTAGRVASTLPNQARADLVLGVK